MSDDKLTKALDLVASGDREIAELTLREIIASPTYWQNPVAQRVVSAAYERLHPGRRRNGIVV